MENLKQELHDFIDYLEDCNVKYVGNAESTIDLYLARKKVAKFAYKDTPYMRQIIKGIGHCDTATQMVMVKGLRISSQIIIVEPNKENNTVQDLMDQFQLLNQKAIKFSLSPINKTKAPFIPKEEKPHKQKFRHWNHKKLKG